MIRLDAAEDKGVDSPVAQVALELGADEGAVHVLGVHGFAFDRQYRPRDAIARLAGPERRARAYGIVPHVDHGPSGLAPPAENASGRLVRTRIVAATLRARPVLPIGRGEPLLQVDEDERRVRRYKSHLPPHNETNLVECRSLAHRAIRTRATSAPMRGGGGAAVRPDQRSGAVRSNASSASGAAGGRRYSAMGSPMREGGPF